MSDVAIRQAAFEFLDMARAQHGDVLPWSVLLNGFSFDGRRVPLIGQQGIFKPAAMELPFCITTAPLRPGRERPYDDQIRYDGTLEYCYRGTDPNHRDNVGLREAWRRNVPLVHYFGIVKGLYLPYYPVFIIADHPDKLRFVVEVNDRSLIRISEEAGIRTSDMDRAVERRYTAVLARRRLHQKSFSVRVLQAYREHCAVCRLRHRELLEAAHIIPDSEDGPAIVRNGLALCKLHHAAFDSHILGIRPDLVIEIRRDILKEVDGPMLNFGLQGFEGKRLMVVPRSRDSKPAEEFLEARYERFRKAG